MAARQRRSSGKRPRSRVRWWVRGLLALAILAVVGLAGAVVAVAWVEASLPDIPTFEEYALRTPKVSRMLASDGTVLAEFFVERRTLMLPDRIPPLVEKAFLAAEDASFREHGGLSWGGIARAMIVNLWRGRISQGGSTISQQVVKQVLLDPERTWQRKFRELLLVRRLEARLTKDEILAMYLSEVYLGSGNYGVEEAARWWFGKDAAALTIGEAALLAGLVSGPEANHPVRNPTGARARRRYVLDRMTDLGWVSPEEAARALAAPLPSRSAPAPSLAPYFTDAVRREVTRIFGIGRLNREGLRIRTTLDPETQRAAEIAVQVTLSRLYQQGRTRTRDEEAGRSEPPEDEVLDPTRPLPDAPQVLPAQVVRCHGGEIEVEVAGRRARLEPRSLARRILAGHPDPYAICRIPGARLPVSVLDPQEDPPRVQAEDGPQAALVALDPRTRAVRALVGGEDFEMRPFNRAVQSRRPIGSTVKPFLYAAARMNGLSADTEVANTAVSFRGARGRRWTPRNFEGGYDGRLYSLPEAMVQSINVVAVKVLAEMGSGPLVDLLRSVGIDGAIPRDLSLALGSAEASPLALANAFADIAADGRHDTPYFIESVLDALGREVIRHEVRPSQVLPPAIARWVRQALREAVLRGTARAAASLPVPAWGKTGTTNRSREAWFAGSDGRLVVAILVGHDDRLPMPGATGGNTAVPLFADFVRSRIPGGSPDPGRPQ
ncbi:MAG TPA: transglycosylase domain-containing protein [Myxococcota bacterium]|nr:transglycosylase domain-containing protein [Myxococcota bacterium]HQK49731.1 transglycosylase domain-containing protein [Myxococcota bacterium]